VEIPTETCEGGLGAARPTTDVASQYITADKLEVTASYTSLEVTTSLSTLNTQTLYQLTLYWALSCRGPRQNSKTWVQVTRRRKSIWWQMVYQLKE